MVKLQIMFLKTYYATRFHFTKSCESLHNKPLKIPLTIPENENDGCSVLTEKLNDLRGGGSSTLSLVSGAYLGKTHIKKSGLFSGRTTKGVGVGNPPDH